MKMDQIKSLEPTSSGLDMFSPSAKHFVPASINIFNKVQSMANTVPDQLTPPSTPLDTATDQVSETELRALADNIEVLEFNGKIQIEEPIGKGAWSQVFAARKQQQVSESTTPPVSPISVSRLSNCLAVKVPKTRLAHSVLENEAQILTYLSRSSIADSYIVRFFGKEMENDSLVFARASQTLSDFASNAFKTQQLMQTSNVASVAADPIIGRNVWVRMALQLVRGLAWIHSMGVVHGDIKSSNVLMTEDCTAVFCDFSSARFTGPSIPAQKTDAITTTYASPELLRAYSKSFVNPSDMSVAPVVTENTDIWAMAVTLLVAAVGEEPYAHTHLEMRKLAMAKEGMILEGFRMGKWTSGAKVRPGSMVEKAVRGALAMKVEARIGISAWVEALELLAKEIGLD
jgi:hypothetical protein